MVRHIIAQVMLFNYQKIALADTQLQPFLRAFCAGAVKLFFVTRRLHLRRAAGR